MLLAEFSAEYVATSPSHDTLDGILIQLFVDSKASIIGDLANLYRGYGQHGYRKGNCSLQLDLTTISNKEYCTASVSVIKAGEVEPEHLSLATKMFEGTHKQADVSKWIREARTFFFS